MPSLLEIFANITLLLSAFLAAKNNKHTWSVGVVSCILFGVLFYQAKLYADVTLQVFFIATSIYGWFYWLNEKDAIKEKPITTIPTLNTLLYVLAGCLVSALYGWLLFRFTDAYMPRVDASVLSLSILAQLMLMNRKIETWFYWFIADVISVWLYASRGLYLTSGVYVLLTINVLYGAYVWYSEYKNQPESVKE